MIKQNSISASQPVRALLASMTMTSLLLVVSPATAADLSISNAAPIEQREWKVIISPYVWGAGLKGNSSILGVPAHIDVPFDKTLRNLDFALMGSIEITNGTFGVYIDGQYADVSKDETIRSVQIGTGMTSTTMSAGVYYRMFESQLGGDTTFGTPRTFAIEPTIGVRWTKLSAALEGLGHHISASDSWTDPFVGTRMSLDLSNRWNLAMEGDVGGFGSRLSLGGQAYLGYRTKLLGHDSIVRAGYRALYQDYESKDFDWKVTQHGQVVGVSMHF